MKPAKKLVLFGASKAGETYLKKQPPGEVIAFIDNDPHRQGSAVDNIPVLAPAALHELKFDLVVITSLWVDSIYSQLTQQLGIAKDKIYVPHKTKLKSEHPFSEEETLTLGHQLLIGLNQFFIQHQIKACIDSGTLLGLLREGRLLSWDDDIDFAVDDTDFARALTLLKSFHQHIPMQDKANWHATLLTLSGTDVCLNIEFTPKPGSTLIPFETSLQRRRSLNGRSELLSSAGIFYAPEHHFNHHDTLDFMGHAIRIPSKAPEFLTFMYGDWKTPKKAMTLHDYDNRRPLKDTTSGMVSISKRAFW